MAGSPSLTMVDWSQAVELADYTAADNDEALALERASPQGGALKLSFRRPTFERRAQLFPVHRIVTARLDRRLAGIVAVAVKEMELFQRPGHAAFLFDLRVDPAARRRGVARALGREVLAWGLARADLAYFYVINANRPVRRMAHQFGCKVAGECRYLVVPASWGQQQRGVTPCDPGEVHTSLRRICGPFDLVAGVKPALSHPARPWRGSWIVQSGSEMAGCSAWSNRDIFAEVVEALPLSLRLVGALRRAAPARSRLPHVPSRGEELRSWYLYDAFAQNQSLARVLARHVAAEARAQDVDYLYLVHTPRDRWVEDLKSELPRFFAPVVGFKMLARAAEGPPPHFERLHVDIRDL
jgi:ribosomal protein S18 acetylase RimI-like enzyme